jgi:hypothetical protein
MRKIEDRNSAVEPQGLGPCIIRSESDRETVQGVDLTIAEIPARYRTQHVDQRAVHTLPFSST